MVESATQQNDFLAETIGDTVERFLASKKNGIACLKEIYKAASKWPEESVRCGIYRDRKQRFKRVAKGVYLLVGKESASLLIRGNGRKLDEIEDNSISAIINDHPWKNEKAHKSGNQKCFADYETFCYTQEDFEQKARVLIQGGYLAEFLPVRSFTNKKYLNQIEEMAEKANLNYYASVIWRIAPEGVINTGRTTKGVEQIVIFTKGKARCLNSGGKAYQTTRILNYEIDIPANKGKHKSHQAEKPIALYKYLIEQLTKEKDVCLDQFGGSCNMAKAAVETNRFSIVYEICKEFIQKAVDRFKMFTLYETSEDEETTQDAIAEEAKEEEIVASEIYEVNMIPREATIAQKAFLHKVLKQIPDFFTEDEKRLLQDEGIMNIAQRIDSLYKKINERGYQSYRSKLPEFDTTRNIETYIRNESLCRQIDQLFEEKFPDIWTRCEHENYRIEAKTLAAYCVVIHSGVNRLKDIPFYLEEYCDFLEKKGYKAQRSRRLLKDFLEFNEKINKAA